MKRKRFLRILLLLAGLLLAAAISIPVGFIGLVWLRDGRAPLADPKPGTDDASHMNANVPPEVIAVASDPMEAERQLVALVRRATQEKTHIAISGADHSMGAHTIYPGAIVLDMLPFHGMSLDEKARLLTVGAGARWAQIIPFLDQKGFAVAIMQSNNDFTVGGSLSVNCHGWQNDAPPIASTVEAIRVLTADGTIRRCSRTENQELFSLVLGGYGLFGIILDATLRVVPNDFYVAEAHLVKAEDYARVYHELTRNRSNIRMAYGRINVAPSSFMENGIVTILTSQGGARPVANTLTAEKPSLLKRLVFRGGADSSFGKNLRWWLERQVGETAGEVLSRNQIMNEPAQLYATRDSGTTDILHEYFIPSERLAEFIAKARPVFLRHKPDLLNITVRNVEPDQDTFMRYATGEVFGLVMLFNQSRTAAADAAMQALTRDLIDVALECGGRYYLPYRPHATAEQFLHAYPQAPEFFALKRRYDPAGVFENTFYLNYGKPLE